MKAHGFGALVIVALMACGDESVHERSPLGTLTPARLAAWSMWCPTEIVIEDVCGRTTPQPDCDRKHYTLTGFIHAPPRYDLYVSATRRFRCRAPEGWSLWVDARDRVHGICVDPASNEPGDGLRRAYDLIARDQGSDIVAEWIRLKFERMRTPYPMGPALPDPNPGRWTTWQERVGLRYRGAETAVDGDIEWDLSDAKQYSPARATCVEVRLAK